MAATGFENLMGIRIVCQVLQCIAIHSPIDSLGIQRKLPHLNADQIQKATWRLLQQDKTEKTGVSERMGSGGRPTFLYQCRENPNSPAPKKRPGAKKGRQNYRESLRAPRAGASGLYSVNNRDRKIRLLKEIIPTYSDSFKDLLIGILSDYGGKI